MLIKYYKNSELAYTNRRRYKVLNFTPFAEENQKSVLLGDGANTSIKTKKENICNYVTIDGTRWYVTSYVYMNGGQVTLNLQRDVIGEFGLNDCFGKIERGYTETLLRNRKELQLNQILKKRINLETQGNFYGNAAVDTHINEKWGILYITKPAEGQVVIPIPQFTPTTLNYSPVSQNTFKLTRYNSASRIEFIVAYANNLGRSYKVTVNFKLTPNDAWIWEVNAEQITDAGEATKVPAFLIDGTSFNFDYDFNLMSKNVGSSVASAITQNQFASYYELPDIPKIPTPLSDDYDGAIIKVSDTEYRKYTVKNDYDNAYGKTPTNNVDSMLNILKGVLENTMLWGGSYGLSVTSVTLQEQDTGGGFALSPETYFSSNFTLVGLRYTYVLVSSEEAGVLTLDVSQQNLVDEPYYILVCPLYDVNVETTSGKTYNINKTTAFEIFNNVIQTLSGENGYLVDAQIYPYCPILTSVKAEIRGFPFFTIQSTSYYRYCTVQLLPSSNIKKEYIQREYSIVSPEQSSKFTFKFYDYVNTIEDNNGVNYRGLNIIIKTALKPFAIIASAVINPEEGSLMNMTYSSDLRGSQPTSNGFECSLATNAFETYKRQNSNFQQIFEREQETLRRQHEVELTNDITSTVVNTASATAMGALAGASMADVGLLKLGKTAGAVTGGALAGAGVGTAMGFQTSMNEGLRAYERETQQFMFDMNIGTIKNLPNTINRISSFNEIILRDFFFVIEVYECSDLEKNIVNNFINNYAYAIGVFDFVSNYLKNGWFLRSTLVKSNYAVNLHNIASNELKGGIYYYYE